MSQANVRMAQQSDKLHLLAFKVTNALEHLQREMRGLDWHPADTMGSGTSHGSEPSRPTERTAVARYELTSRVEQIRDDLQAVESVIESLNAVCEEALGYRAPGAQLFDPDRPILERCNGKVDATCDNAASEHHHPTTQAIIAGFCSSCFLQLCRGCFERPAETRRQILVDGRRVPGCAACQRRQQRQAA